MDQMVRQCPDCGDERLFARVHDVAEGCPDSPGGTCPEWCCTDCGAALLIGFPPPLDGIVPSLEELALAELADELAGLVGKVA
ncbi:MAG TPA: hypothetical protein VGS19_35630 [Streptosporangiaceae bacterium]|nr:hypothetical protein [Streptosporangiaceae bacterium]